MDPGARDSRPDEIKLVVVLELQRSERRAFVSSVPYEDSFHFLVDLVAQAIFPFLERVLFESLVKYCAVVGCTYVERREVHNLTRERDRYLYFKATILVLGLVKELVDSRVAWRG